MCKLSAGDAAIYLPGKTINEVRSKNANLKIIVCNPRTG